MSVLAQVSHILPFTTIRRERVLPPPGRVTVRKGQQVNATDIVAEGNLIPEHLLLDIARSLSLPVEETNQHIQCQEGDEVGKGDIIAGPVGVSRRVVRAPESGKVVLVGDGQVLLELQSQTVELRAGLPGVVEELLPERGVVISTPGALVQGVWGNGRIDFGLLVVRLKSPDEVITADQMDMSFRGSILLAGYCSNVEVLQAAEDLPLRGLILSSMDSALIPVALKMQYPIILIEGFGRLPMNSVAYKLLSTSERREVTLNAETWDRYAGTRPEIIIPLPAEGLLSPPPATDVFTAGQKVRIVSTGNKGQIGLLISLKPGLTALPSGLRAQVAEVRLENGTSVTLPLTNLEVIE